MASEAQELQRQLSQLDRETEDIKQMSLSIEELHDKLNANKLAREKLRKKLLDLGYSL